MSLKQPIGQKRLTNVAVVRYKKKGKRFEIACYKNKVVNWRTGVEKEIDDVLQTTAVFSNVSKGVLAKHEDLVDVFGTDDEEKICQIILKDGDYQVSDKEREVEFESNFKDVAKILAEKCVHPETNRPYTISMLERALRDIHFSVDLKRPAKLQALEILPKLKEKISIERAKMQLRILVPKSAGPDTSKKLLDFLQEQEATIESQDSSSPQVMLLCQIDPGCYRVVHNFVQQLTHNSGQVEVVSLAVNEQGDSHSRFDTWGSRPPSVPNATDTSSQGQKDARSREGDNGDVQTLEQPKIAGTTTRESQHAAAASLEVLFSRGPVAQLPDEYESRRERFVELDSLQPGWTVELCRKRGSSAVDAVFHAPNGEKVGSFANARRAALLAHKIGAS